jgi:hypothetical protein
MATDNHNTSRRDVLPFPQRNKGRIRKTRSIEAGGELILTCLAQAGEITPPNVERIIPLPAPTPLERSPELLLAITLWGTVPKEKQAAAISQLRHIGSGARCPHALALVALLDGEARALT